MPLHRTALPPVMFFLALFLSTSSSPAKDFEITKSSLDALSKEVLATFKKETGVSLDEIRFEPTNRKALRKVLEKELLPQLKVQFDDLDAAKQQTRQAAEFYASVFLAKFAPATKTIMVCAKNIVAQSKQAKEPRLRSRSTLFAILVHECVHAMDAEKYDWAKVLNSLKSTEELLAYNAVIEGHAQFVARKICKKPPLKEGFEVYEETIGKIPDEGDESQRYLARYFAATVASAYYDGERFVRTLHEKGGEKAVATAFRKPPRRQELIFHPQWYLDPESKPRNVYDFKPAIKDVVKRFDASVWSSRELTATPAQLRAGLSLLPKKDIDRALKNMKQNLLVSLYPTAAPGTKMVVVCLYEFASPTDARRFFATQEKLVRIKDKKMASGFVAIKKSSYKEIITSTWQGLYFEKEAAVGPQTVKIYSAIAVHGPLGVEVLYSGQETTRDQIVETISGCLRKSQVGK